MEITLEALVQAGESEIYPGYTLRLVRATGSGNQLDTPEQRFYWEVAWKVKDLYSAQRAWDSSSIVRGLTEEQQGMFY